MSAFGLNTSSQVC